MTLTPVLKACLESPLAVPNSDTLSGRFIPAHCSIMTELYATSALDSIDLSDLKQFTIKITLTKFWKLIQLVQLIKRLEDPYRLNLATDNLYVKYEIKALAKFILLILVAYFHSAAPPGCRKCLLHTT